MITSEQIIAVFKDGIAGVNGAVEDAADAVRKLVDELVEQRDELTDRVDELECAVKEADADNSDLMEAYEDALIAVKYWMMDVLVHHKPMSDPRKILRIVERALEP